MSNDSSGRMVLRGSCVKLGERAVLLRGASGAGKSDLALRLIDAGGMLIADDYVEIERRGAAIWASPPPRIAGLLEVRGAGIVALDYSAGAPIGLIVDLVAPEAVPRMPEPAEEQILGQSIPRYGLAPFEASAPAKIRMILQALGQDRFRTDVTRL